MRLSVASKDVRFRRVVVGLAAFVGRHLELIVEVEAMKLIKVCV